MKKAPRDKKALPLGQAVLDEPTMNFNVGTDTPATFDIVLSNSTGPFAVPFSTAIPAVDRPEPFTMSWSPFPNLGTIEVRVELGTGLGQGLCAEWTTVNTAQ